MEQRQFKFRAWDGVKMFAIRPFHMLHYADDGDVSFTDGEIDHGGYKFVRDIVLMQWTGLKDKNGAEIYESDVLRKMGEDYYAELANEDDDPPIVEIERDVATMERFPTFWLKNEGFGYEGEDLEEPTAWEVIGNIFEHPHLLK